MSCVSLSGIWQRKRRWHEAATHTQPHIRIQSQADVGAGAFFVSANCQASEAHQMNQFDRNKAAWERIGEKLKLREAMLDRLLTCVPGPDSKGYKLAEILEIAEEWQRIR
jgi:hypothetical protein